METWQQRRADSHSDIDILAGTLFAAGALSRSSPSPPRRCSSPAAWPPSSGRSARSRPSASPHADRARPAGRAPRHRRRRHRHRAGHRPAARPAHRGTSVTVLGTPEPPPLTWARVAMVAAVACAVVLLGTIRPALRGIRQSTSGRWPPAAPAEAARPAGPAGREPRRPAAGRPGHRSAWRRPGRLLTNAAGLLLGVAMIVVALALRDSLGLLSLTPSEPGHAASDAAVGILYDQVRAAHPGHGRPAARAGHDQRHHRRDVRRPGRREQPRGAPGGGATPRQTVTALVVSQLGACAHRRGRRDPARPRPVEPHGGRRPAAGERLRRAALVLLAAAVPVVFAAIVRVPRGCSPGGRSRRCSPTNEHQPGDAGSRPRRGGT